MASPSCSDVIIQNQSLCSSNEHCPLLNGYIPPEACDQLSYSSPPAANDHSPLDAMDAHPQKSIPWESTTNPAVAKHDDSIGESFRGGDVPFYPEPSNYSAITCKNEDLHSRNTPRSTPSATMYMGDTSGGDIIDGALDPESRGRNLFHTHLDIPAIDHSMQQMHLTDFSIPTSYTTTPSYEGGGIHEFEREFTQSGVLHPQIPSEYLNSQFGKQKKFPGLQRAKSDLGVYPALQYEVHRAGPRQLSQLDSYRGSSYSCDLGERHCTADEAQKQELYELLTEDQQICIDQLRKKINAMPRRKLRDCLAKNVQLFEIEPLMSVNRDDIALLLGVGVTTWKQFIHKSFNIPRWPARMFKSLEVKEKNLRQKLREAEASGNESQIADIRQQICEIQDERTRKRMEMRQQAGKPKGISKNKKKGRAHYAGMM